MSHNKVKITKKRQIMKNLFLNLALFAFLIMPVAVLAQGGATIIVIEDIEGRIAAPHAKGGVATFSVQFTVNPNPFTDYLEINKSAALEISALSIVNENGVTVFNTALSGKESSLTAPALPVGIYYLKLTTNQGELSKMVIRE